MLFRPGSALSGFTLLELLVALGIIGILSSLTLPALSTLVKKNRADSIQSLLRSAINTTRVTAISDNSIAVLCPVDAGSCGSDWNRGFMIFTDRNNDRILDEEETLIEYHQLHRPGFEISWRASAGRNFLRFSPAGIAREFGRFTLCHQSRDMSLARSMVVNRHGRLRIFRDNNGDGIAEGVNGERPDCG